ncbi:MAG: 30S ribosomal protein S12 methylthiotransferase RimO [Bacteroidales bacterium]
MTNKKINIVTLGCSKNKVDSEQLAGMLDQAYTVVHDSEENSDIVIINTCGFIGDAKEESVDTILSFAESRKAGDISKLIVMGCLSQRYQKDLQNDIHEVDAFFGVNDLDAISNILRTTENQISIPEHYHRVLSTPSHYAYLKISEGCDRSCSFCAIPLIRGKHRSVPIEKLLAEASELAACGVKELVLIAQDLTYYGLDLYGKREISKLIAALSEIDGIEWIRLQYAYPAGFPEDLISQIASNPKVCRYIDLPLQHISNRILKSMKRSITKEQTISLVESIRKNIPDVAFRTTLIVGYPGETVEEFNELVQFVKEQRFDRLGVFAYSAEDETPAFTLEDDITEEVKQERLDSIMAVQQEISLELNLQKLGKSYKVLIDRLEGDYFIGRSEFDSPEVDNEILIKKSKKLLKVGSFYSVEIVESDYFDLYGKVV